MLQKNKPVITVLSTFTKDILVNESGQIIKKQDGGPAFFIKKVFDKEKIDYELRTGLVLNVEILVTDKGEFGKIENSVGANNVEGFIGSSNLLISTLFDEWPMAVEGYNGRVFIDIQGFVRQKGDFGNKKDIEMAEGYKPFCIKGTEQEISHINQAFIEEQKRERCLIETKGKDGAGVFYQGKIYDFRPDEVVAANNTLGVGDTFFASFITTFIDTSDIGKSGVFATERAVSFLKGL